MSRTAAELYADTYDMLGVGWSGELEFYRGFAAEATSRGESVLEAACGTGRIAIALAEDGARVTGFDRSPEMLAVARRKSRGIASLRWVEADMHSFDLGERFGLAIIPAHSFQFMLTPKAQIACLDAVQRHLTPDGTIVVHLDHQDIGWLGGLPAAGTDVGERGNVIVHPVTGRRLRRTLAWTYERATQTATVTVLWEEIDAHGMVTGRWEQEPMPLHCVFRFEMEHLLARAGLRVEAVYGDFFRGALQSDSSEMIWIARRTPHL